MNTPTTIIIGAGPAGASAAIYLTRYNKKVILFDAHTKIHGRTAMASNLENFLTHTKNVSGPTFIQNFNTQLKKYPIEIINKKVVKVSQSKNSHFTVETDDKNIYQGKFLIIAIGFRDIGLKLDNLDDFYNNGI